MSSCYQCWWCDKAPSLICKNLSCWLHYCFITEVAAHACWVLGWKTVCCGIVGLLGFVRSLILMGLVHVAFVHGDGLWWMELEAVESEASKFRDLVAL